MNLCSNCGEPGIARPDITDEDDEPIIICDKCFDEWQTEYLDSIYADLYGDEDKPTGLDN